MDLKDFKSSLVNTTPPENISICLQALWYDGKNDWNAAHHTVDGLEDKLAYRVHAYLHRKEGDRGNAAYWYKRAGEKMPDCPLASEWNDIVEELLK